jgi:hypothetical protein
MNKDELIYSLEYTQNNKTKIDIINNFNKDIDDYEKKNIKKYIS